MRPEQKFFLAGILILALLLLLAAAQHMRWVGPPVWMAPEC